MKDSAAFRESEFREYCIRRGLSADLIEVIVPFAAQFSSFLGSRRKDIGTADECDVRDYFACLMAGGPVPVSAVRAVALCGLLARNHDVAIYGLGRRSADGAMRAIRRRVEEVLGKEVCDAVYAGLEMPPAGSPPETHASMTRKMVRELGARLPEHACREVLTCNAHEMLQEAFSKDKEMYHSSGSIDEYLRWRHHRLVAELVQAAASGELWYEQRITPAVVEFVRHNQEIQSGVRDGRTIYVTKIPFAPQEYLDATDPAMKRYYACHCPLARESILTPGEEVPPVFCYCSGGFEKMPFDVIFGRPVEVKVLESALAGDMRCRFAVTIPEEA